MPPNLRPILLVVLVGLVLVFAVQNVANVEVQFLIWSIAMPRAILIAVVFALGVLIGWILHGLRRRRRQGADSAEQPGLPPSLRPSPRYDDRRRRR